MWLLWFRHVFRWHWLLCVLFLLFFGEKYICAYFLDAVPDEALGGSEAGGSGFPDVVVSYEGDGDGLGVVAAGVGAHPSPPSPNVHPPVPAHQEVVADVIPAWEEKRK